MQIQEMNWYSERLSRNMPLKVYGHAGKPCLVIPSQNGKHNDFEGFGMVGACSPWIDAGKLRLSVSTPLIPRPGPATGKIRANG